MKGLVYVSSEQVPFDEASLQELAVRAAATNGELGVTGYLYYSKGRFLQYLEGASTAVEELMARIARDPRHDVLTTVIDYGISARRFPAWHMRWINPGLRTRIELEGVLSDHLLFIKTIQEITHSDQNWHPRVWAMIDKLADTQQRLGLL